MLHIISYGAYKSNQMNKAPYTLVLWAAAMLFGCAPAEQNGASEQSTVSMDDEFSVKIELLFDKYVQNEWDVMDLYAEDVVCKINNLEFSGRENLMGGFKMHHDALYSNIDIKDMRIQSEYWSDGEVWSRSWFTWTGDGQTTGDSYSNRGHFGYKWEDGRIVELHGYWSEDAQNTEAAAYAAAKASE
jgi:ketosteroid isomerase-like protein